MTAPLLEVKGLTVAYERDGRPFQAVRNANFSLGAGDTLGIVGESGSGKSTIAFAVAGYLPENGRIASGSIGFAGADISSLAARHRYGITGKKIAMVYQDPAGALNPIMPIGEQIAEVYRLHNRCSRAAAREKTVDMLHRVHLRDPHRAYDKYAHQFSGGQQQRIVIAMALAAEPSLLILDEPTTGLDVSVEAEILALIAELRTFVKASILYISHDVRVISDTCDRVAVMYAGEIVESGPTTEILRSPSHPYTRALLDCLIPFGAVKESVRLASIDGQLDVAHATGCSFAPRCSLAEERCHQKPPPMATVADKRASRCYFYDKIPTKEIGRSIPTRRSNLDQPRPLLNVDNVEKQYAVRGNQTRALASVTLSIPSNRVIGVIGESGSGKTTLARVISGLELPSSGSLQLGGAKLHGRVQNRPVEIRRAIQMVFQNPNATLNPSHTAGYALRRAVQKLTGLRGARCEARVRELLASVKLGPRHLEALPEQLSGGERQRIAIARAFAAQPALVLCDEPTSALDVSARAIILNLLADIQASTGTSYIFISHDLATVRYIADEIIVMYLGDIVAIGSAAGIFERPVHPYVETLVNALLPSRQRRDLQRVESSPPASNTPRGCVFHQRCPYKVGPICEEPPPWQTSMGHRYRCVIAPERLAYLQRSHQVQVESK